MNGVSRTTVVLLAVSSLWAQQFVIHTVAGGAAPLNAAAAAQVSIGDPPRVAVDSSGNVYFGSLHSVFRVDRSGALTRIAGIGRSGYTGDGGLALNAQLTEPYGIAVDSSGAVYVVDRGAHVARKIAAGVISTVAGNGTAGYSGDGGTATAAQLNAPTGIAVDPAGNLYVGDTGNNVVRKISGGTIATFAGTGTPGYVADGVAATSTPLNQPQGVAWDSGGNLEIADTNNYRVRRVNAAGIVTTFAGNGLANYSGDNIGGTGIVTSTGDNGAAASASVILPTDVAADSSGHVYITDFGNSRVRVVSSAGIITTVIGNPDGVSPEEGQAATSIRLNGPTGVAVDSSGTVYFTEGSVGAGSGLVEGDCKVWRVSGGLFSTFAGNGLASYSGDGAAATAAELNMPANMALDSSGNLFFADTANHRIRKVSVSGAISTVAGNGTAGFSGDGKSALNAQLNTPGGVAVDSAGTLYIADTNNNRVRVVTPDGIIYTLAGNGNAGFYGDGGMAVKGALHAPQAVAVDGRGNFYIADTLDYRVRKVTQSNIITTIAGNGVAGFSGDGGPGYQAALNLPVSLALDSAGNVYIADKANGRIRMVAPSGTISTVAGSGNSSDAPLYNPSGVVVDSAGNIDIADTGHNRIRQAFSGGIVTIAGTGACCYAGDGAAAQSALLNAPSGMAIDPAGTIYFSDAGNNAIRMLTPGAAVAAAITSVANAASNLTGAIAPGEIITISGVALGPPQLVPEQVGSDGIVTSSLSGTTVTIAGIAAPIVYTSSTQVSAVVPFEVAGSTATIVVQYRGQTPAQTTVAVAATAPALFTADYSGKGQALALNQDGSANGNCAPNLPGTPVHAACFQAGLNQLLTLFVNGAGQTSPASIDGQMQGLSTPSPVQPISVKIGGIPATVLFSSSVPAEIAGIIQVEAQIPGSVTPGTAVPVVAQVGTASTQQATISIAQ